MNYWLRLVRETVDDWKARRIAKPRSILPADGETAATLRYIRRQACRASGVVDCPVWCGGELSYAPGTNPCTQCKTMGIGLQSLSESLWGIKSAGLGAGELVIDESDLRGWINGRDPIPTHRLRVAVLKAWACGWMTSSQAVSAISTISDREVAGSVARQFLKRLRSGKALGTPESLASWVEAEREAQERAAMEGQTKVLDLTDGVLNIAALSGAQAKLLQICSTEGAKSC